LYDGARREDALALFNVNLSAIASSSACACSTGHTLTLAPLTPEQALAAALKIKPADLKKLEAAEARGKKRGGRKKR
jgi:hypothetical protein